MAPPKIWFNSNAGQIFPLSVAKAGISTVILRVPCNVHSTIVTLSSSVLWVTVIGVTKKANTDCISKQKATSDTTRWRLLGFRAKY